MTTASLRALAQFSAALDQLGIPFFVGGSMATSVHGVMRSTQDFDVIVELAAADVTRLQAALGPSFEVDAEALAEAATLRRSCNLFFLPEFTRIDLYVAEGTAFDRSRMARRQRVRIPGMSGGLPVASPEDAVLKKLARYQKGNETSARQWEDVLGVLRVQGGALDVSYLDRWAADLGVHDLLKRALQEASHP